MGDFTLNLCLCSDPNFDVAGVDRLQLCTQEVDYDIPGSPSFSETRIVGLLSACTARVNNCGTS